MDVRAGEGQPRSVECADRTGTDDAYALESVLSHGRQETPHQAPGNHAVLLRSGPDTARICDARSSQSKNHERMAPRRDPFVRPSLWPRMHQNHQPFGATRFKVPAR